MGAVDDDAWLMGAVDDDAGSSPGYPFGYFVLFGLGKLGTVRWERGYIGQLTETGDSPHNRHAGSLYISYFFR